MIRCATDADVAAMLGIYAPYIKETSITFEYDVPSPEQFAQRFRGISARYPWLVWEEDGRILGYAYADTAFVRAAYAWDADMSVYLDRDARGRGIGSALYGCLEEILRNYGYHNLYALITADNLPSVRFHEKRGYVRLGTLVRSGWKVGKWHDVDWLGLRLRPAEAPGEAPGAFACTQQDLEVMAFFSREEGK